MATKVKLPREDKVFYSITYTIVTLLTLSVFYPIIFVISSSFSSGWAVSTGQVVLWPVDATVEGYRRVFLNKEIWLGFRNTLFYTFFGTLNNVMFTMFPAYPMSRADMPGRKLFTAFFLVSMYFGGGMIVMYVLFKDIGYLNTIWAILVPGSFSIYQMIVCRTFINSNLPNEMLEATQIDGCNDFRYFFTFVMPLSKAILAVMTLQFAVGHWNSYMAAHIYLTDRRLYPLQSFLRQILVLSNIDPTQFAQLSETDAEELRKQQGIADIIKYALIVISTAPVMCIYPFIQKYFVQGIMIGSLKG